MHIDFDHISAPLSSLEARVCDNPNCDELIEPFYQERLGRYVRGPRTCEMCRQGALLDKKEDEFLERQRRAGIPKKYQWFLMAQHVRQKPHEKDHEFAQRCERDKKFGIPDGKRRLYRDIVKWKETGLPNKSSLMIQGPVGSGKTTLAIVLLNHLLYQPTEITVVPKRGTEGRIGTEIQGCRVKSAPNIYYSTESEWHSQRKNRNRTKMWDRQDPVERAANAGIWFLDDFCSAVNLQDWDKSEFQEIVDYRYKMQKPMILTTNGNKSRIREMYGERVLSRLDEMIGWHWYEMDNFNWRCRFKVSN